MRVGIVISPERRKSKSTAGRLPITLYYIINDMEEADACQVRFHDFVLELLLSEIADKLREDGL